MIHSYCNYGIYNEDTSQCLEDGDSVANISYWQNGHKITLKDAQIKDINEDEITIEIEAEGCELTIPIEDIADWDNKQASIPHSL